MRALPRTAVIYNMGSEVLVFIVEDHCLLEGCCVCLCVHVCVWRVGMSTPNGMCNEGCLNWIRLDVE